jgi:hypothetical protein
MKHCVVLLLLPLLLTTRTFAQAPPVAGLDTANISITLAAYQIFRFQMPNSASGTIDTWRYIIKDAFQGAPLGDYTLTAFSPQVSYALTYPFVNPVTVTQIVTNVAGADTFSATFPVHCGTLDAPVAYTTMNTWLSLPSASFCAATSDECIGYEVGVSSPFLLSSGVHTQVACGTDTFSLPGPVTVCGYYWNCTCGGNSETTCDTFNLPCWRPPVVGWTAQVTGLQAQFLSTAIATAGATYAWDFGDGSTSTVPDPLHAYGGSGMFTVCLTVTDTCGTTTICDPVSVGIAAVHDPSDTRMNLFPNPHQGNFTVAYHSGEAGTLHMQVHDIQGRQVHRQDVHAEMGITRYQFHLSLPPGLYMLTLTGEDGRQSVRKMQVK